MSLTKEALQYLEEMGRSGLSIEEGQAMIVGQNFAVEDMERFQEARRRFRGHFKTDSLSSFLEYVKAWSSQGLPIFIDKDRMAAATYLDIGGNKNPGHCEHKALLTLPKTPEYQAFLDGCGSLNQEGLIELIEDWGHCMAFSRQDGDPLEKNKVINAIRKVKIDDLTTVTSDKEDYAQNTGVMNSVSVKQAERLPSYITWTIKPYDDLPTHFLNMRVSILTGQGIRFNLRAVALEAQQQEMATQFADTIKAELVSLQCLIGTFTP